MTRSRVGLWAVWLGVYAVTTVLLYAASGLPDIRVAHAVLAYLVLVIMASRQEGRALSMTMVGLSYLAVKWFYVPPRFTLRAATQLDGVLLAGFVITGWMLSELFAKQRAATRIAEERTREVERLSAERLQLEREASTARVMREADRLKNALLSSLAHDLRSPVSTLSLLSDPAAGFTADVALSRVHEEAQRLGEYIATLQRFAAEGGGSMLALDVHDATALVHTALRSSAGVLAGRRVDVVTRQEGIVARCDLTLTMQVLGNLLQNAVRYAPAGAPIDVTVSATPSTVELAVADRGPGVGEQELDRLFVPLQSRPSAAAGATGDTVASGGRMGMGLAIARTFARAQRGDVMYRPRAGGGAEFIVQLPRAPVG
ncbi:ATP-binding protein [Gemmatimonas sp.]|uniref:sensor histidine kinase n=1 Tax=Gemmatimonas sp. TaxID=1962908 RepID=UPI0022CA970F|nr:ATP-binding protein [Gemmatimonas sp.]MCZ8203180.1 ATP-binding protein [Gemmatimonas sp.]